MRNRMLVNNTRSIFDAPKLQEITKIDFLKFIKSELSDGGEISWFTTDKTSFEWSEINVNVRKFLQKMQTLEFNTVGIAIFYSKTKKTVHSSFKIIN